MIKEIGELIDKEIYLFALADETNVGYKKTFEKHYGIVQTNPNHSDYYECQIYFPDLHNSYLCQKDEKIDIRTRENDPEVFL